MQNERDAELLIQASRALEQGEVESAAGTYERVLWGDQANVEALAGLGIALQRLGRFGQALPYLTRAAAAGCGDARAYVSLGSCYVRIGQIDQAVTALRRALQIEPDSVPTRVQLAHLLIKNQQVDEAEALLTEAIELDPDLAAAHDMMAFLLPQMGRFEEAQAYSRKAIALDPRNPSYAVRFLYGAKVTEADRSIVSGLESLADSNTLSLQDRIRVEFGLGKAREDLGEYEFSLQHYKKANSLAAQGSNFDPKVHQREVDYILATTPTSCEGGVESEVPVFIVGMMRSGSTLVEQVVSSHPEVGGAGELSFWLENGPRLHHALATGKDLAQLCAVAQQYVEHLQSLCPGKKRVCDKLLQNYMSLGTIHTALPKARIIHCRRDPRDVCLSIFATPFTYPPPFAFRADFISQAYRQYLRLMAHWRIVLPADRFMEVDYEELVTDREKVSRRMIEFLGLDWNDACLHPERNPRVVGNPSQWQVRQPVYTSSIGRWRRFEPWMGSLLNEWSFEN